MQKITAILTVWKRDHLEEQISNLLEQDHPPSEIWIYHCGEFIDKKFDLLSKYPEIKYQFNSHDLGYFGRFTLALSVQTPFLIVLDDDVVPTTNWLRKCIELCMVNNAIISPSGRILPLNSYRPEQIEDSSHFEKYYAGDNNYGNTNSCSMDTVVDYGCNSWLLRVDWLKYFWSVKPVVYETGEDIHLSASCALLGGIKTICPQQDRSLFCGNLKKDYGIDHFASWRNPRFISVRETVFKYWINELGWMPQEWRKGEKLT